MYTLGDKDVFGTLHFSCPWHITIMALLAPNYDINMTSFPCHMLGWVTFVVRSLLQYWTELWQSLKTRLRGACWEHQTNTLNHPGGMRFGERGGREVLSWPTQSLSTGKTKQGWCFLDMDIHAAARASGAWGHPLALK